MSPWAVPHVHHVHVGGPCQVVGCGWTGLSAVTDGESTSARLRRVEQERDELGIRLVTETGELLAKLDRYRVDRDIAIRNRDLARAELASARAELEQLRHTGWIVARDGGRDCESCDQEIRRGEAYSVNVTGDELTHIHCRNGGTDD